MLFIFRKIRRSFFLPGKVRTYMAYAVGEIVLIVVGILIAVEIGDRNQGRKDRAEETALLIKLKFEFEQNQQLLIESKEWYQENVSGLEALLEVVGPDPEEVPSEIVESGMNGLYAIAGYRPQTGVMNSLTTAGRIVLITNVELNDKLTAWPSFKEKHDFIESVLLDQSADALEYFKGHYTWRTKVLEKRGLESGTSRFTYDQKALLSMLELESLLDVKRIGTLFILNYSQALFDHQKEILDLIDAELQERGIGGS